MPGPALKFIPLEEWAICSEKQIEARSAIPEVLPRFRQLALQFLAIAAAAFGLIVFFVNFSLDGMYADEAVARVAANAISHDEYDPSLWTSRPN
jgi:hypothetical protein